MDVLGPADIERFVAQGFVVVPGAIDEDLRRDWVARAWQRLGYDPADPATWREPRIHMPVVEARPTREAAPRAYRAMAQLLGGEERMQQPVMLGDGFILNLRLDADRPLPPGPAAPGWHKDGDFFMHFLDSPEQGLLTIFLWSDVLSGCGATYIAADSVGPVARHLAAHPEGVNPLGPSQPEHGTGFPMQDLIAQCRDFREATGRAGDVVLMHPYMLHASSANPCGRPRFITNPPVALREPMRFDRERAEDRSPVERAVLRALGVERYAFRPTAPRRELVPARIAQQREMLERERARRAG